MCKPTINTVRVLLGACLLGVAGVSTADVAVIANPAAGISAASADEVKNFYLGKSKSLAGVKVTPVDQADGSPARAEFYSIVIGKDASQLRAYWSKLVFTGKGKPPKAVGADADVISAVRGDAGKVGYVTADQVDGTVVVIFSAP